MVIVCLAGAGKALLLGEFPLRRILIPQVAAVRLPKVTDKETGAEGTTRSSKDYLVTWIEGKNHRRKGDMRLLTNGGSLEAPAVVMLN